MLYITDEHDSFIKCTNEWNDDKIIFFKYLLLLVPSGVILLSFVIFVKWTLIKTLKNGYDFIPNLSMVDAS